MKKSFLITLLLIAIGGVVFSSFVAPLSTGDNCGVFALGKYKVDLSAGSASMEIPKAMLTESIKSGLSFTGTAKCPGTFEIVDLQLMIDGARDAKYTYAYYFVQKMQSMEDYMLLRYFNDAEILHFNNIQVKSSTGEITTIPTVQVVVK